MPEASSTIHLGTWQSIGSPVGAELAALCGFHWLLFDFEHGFESDSVLPGLLRAVGGTGTKAVVRVGAPYPDLIARVLDWGAHGIMVPRVNSADEARLVVQAASYAPRGRRGYSRSSRSFGYGMQVPPDDKSMTQPLVMVQIETIEGVAHAGEIAEVEGVDVLFVGPADLQFDLRARPESVTRDYAASLVEVNRAAAAAQKCTGILVRDLNDYACTVDAGFTYIAVDSDLAILRKGYQRITNLISGGSGGESPG